MSKFKLSLLVFMLAAISFPVMAGEAVVKRVPAGAVAFHFVFDLSYVTGEFVGYISFIEGVDGTLFAGEPSEDTAYFTIRLTEPVPPPLGGPDGLPTPDTALTVSLFPPGAQFTVFYDSEPGPRDWSSPETFSEGTPIAVFDESALQSTGANGVFPGVFFGLFSSRIIESAPIDFDGQRLDFKKLVPDGLTITNFGNGLRFLPDGSPGASGGGTAIAIGGKLR